MEARPRRKSCRELTPGVPVRPPVAEVAMAIILIPCRQDPIVQHDQPAELGMVLAQYTHYLLGLGSLREVCEASEIYIGHRDLSSPRLQ
jgi:hypothetical protein